MHRRLPVLLLALTHCALLATSGYAEVGMFSMGIPIEVREQDGIPRVHELVTVSIPISKAEAIHYTNKLKVTDNDGLEIPAQWRVLTRWGGGPQDGTKPIKFALVKFFANVNPYDTTVYRVLRRSPMDPLPPSDPSAILIDVRKQWVVVDTGAATFDINPCIFNLFQAVRVDLNEDGVITDDERVVDSSSSLGAGLHDTAEGGYLATIDKDAIFSLEEWGPLELTLKVTGRHLPFTSANAGRDFLSWTTRLHFIAGSSAVRVEHTLSNSYLNDPMGAISFARYYLHTRLKVDAPAKATFGGESGAALAPIQLANNEEAFLYQDSAGGAHWNQPGSTFSGWKLFHHMFGDNPYVPETVPTIPPLSFGNKSSGWMNVTDNSKGILVALRFPWQNYPFALRASSEGSITADLWPAEFAGLHWLDDAQRKTHDLTYVFHNKRIDPALEAARASHPLRARAPLEYVRATEAWGDQGTLRLAPFSFESMAGEGNGLLQVMYDTFEEKGNYSWVHFGEPIWYQSTHSPGSWRNRLTWFDRFISSGANEWFELSEIFALHSMDIRTYHIDGFRTEDHPGVHLVEGIPHYTGSDYLGRDMIPSTLDIYKVGIPAGGHGWNGFDDQHMTADDLYEYYLMTGSGNAREALVSMGEGMLTWKNYVPEKPILSSRGIGWTLRALMKVYAVSGDPRVLNKAKKVVEQVKVHRGQTPSPVTGIVYHYLARNIYAGDQHGMTEDFELPWQVAVGIYGLAVYQRDTGDPSVIPILADLANYIVDYGLQGGIVVEALACDNHFDINPKEKNDGVNTWIPSALAIVYGMTGNEKLYQTSKLIYEQNEHDFFNAENFYHWFHNSGDLVDEKATQ